MNKNINTKKIRAFLVLLLSVYGVIFAAGTPSSTGRPLDYYQDRIALVERVVDGDTVILEGGNRVRYIGVDTPESVHPGRPVEPLALEAAAFNRRLVEGKRVFLLLGRDPDDRYGRLLAYVFVGDVFVNARLVREGYARESAYPPNVKFQPLFIMLQEEAKSEKKGLWGLK